MKWNRFKSKILLKYTVSYLLIFLVPLTVVTVTVFKNSGDTLRSEIEQSNLNQLTQVKMSIDERISKLNETAALISFDEQLTPYNLRDPYYSRDAIKALDRYRVNNPSVEEIFIYIRGDENIYSSRGLTNTKSLFEDTYQFEKWAASDLLRELNEVQYPYLRPAEKMTSYSREQSLLAYLVPITPNSPYPHATVMYFVDESYLTGLMDSILNDFTGNSYIFDQNGQILTENNHGDILPAEDLEQLSVLEPGIHSLKLNNRMHSVVSVHSEEFGWTYVTAMPSFQFYDRMIHVQTWIIAIFLIVVLLGIPIAIRVAKQQYHPLKDLMEFAKLNTNTTVADTVKSHNEWDWIRQTINDYSARIDLQEPYVRNQCLMLLLKHGKPDDTEMEQLIRSLKLEVDNGRYFVIMMAWDTPSEISMTDEDRQQIASMLYELELPTQKAYAYGIEQSHSDQIAIMISLEHDPEQPLPQRKEQIVETIRALVMENSHLIPSIGIGTSYDKLDDLVESYIEAATALEMRIISGNGSITYFEKLIHNADETYWIPKNVLLKLTQSLKQGNETLAIHMLDTIIQMIQSQTLSVALTRCICFDLLNTILKTASELDMHDVVNDIPNITSFESLTELKQKLSLLMMQICEQSVRKTESEQYSLVDDIVAYIDQSYADYTLSLEHVALKYSISTSYLSRTFKERTGYNFSQYIWRRRLDEVIRLLLTTNEPLKDIITRVGYLDTPNFIRKFKKETGYTPGQYRKQYSKQNE
ncbi:helix-turn-helix domain-containing protein [Paenibacillus marinisediminis]